ncbi:septum site-determining protein MinC [Gluconobacter sp. Dm-74]|uniref:septum site-determining protein MinC n=1 Tax=Gluconobacter sp. Dm-74 TaxID=2799803 RepID=UPI001B8BE3E3|nr:septum site-determining protein MinC [Gluconobacter sp. Dm-74]MBS1091567.1 septum site-determining protein MinC [Gluconobacter sp. Dm-74]
MPDPVSVPSSTAPMRIRARGRSFLALVLSPEAPLPLWLDGLDYQVARSGGLFTGKPIILDLGLLNENTPGLATLLDDIRGRGVRIIGLEGGSRHWPAVAHWDWPEMLDGGRPAGEVEIPEDPSTSAAGPVSGGGTLIIDQTVRSGQSIQHMQGDVIILGSVSSGAEIVAAGSIHVYGTLRGRAIAGVGGQSQSRIFASRMQAELLALDGYYAVTEDIDPALLGQAAQAALDEDRVRVLPLPV